MDVLMPSLGASSAEVTLVRWLRAPGDRVVAGEPIAEVVTDKVSDEVRAPVEGTLGPPLVRAGAVARVGMAIASISSEAPATSEAGGATLRSDGPGNAAGGSSRPVAPLVRRLAEAHGIDLSDVTGSGPGGRVTKDDIEATVAARDRARIAASAPSTAVPSRTDFPLEEVQAASPIRQAIAANLVQAVTGVPQAWTLVEVDATSLLARRDAQRTAIERTAVERARLSGQTDVRVSAFAVVLHAVAGVIASHPAVNAAWRDGPGGPTARGDDGGRVVHRRRVNVGVAVARPGGGLLVPVLRDADTLDLDRVAIALSGLVEGARNGTLPADAYAGASITLNNTGALGSVTSRPILPSGTAAILTFEAIVRRPVVVAGDAIAIRPIANLCLTFDHRVMDGAEACAFLQDVKRVLEGLPSGS